MANVTLKVLVAEYHSADPANDNQPIDAFKGETISVSAEKAEQVLADFPDWFSKASSRAAAK